MVLNWALYNFYKIQSCIWDAFVPIWLPGTAIEGINDVIFSKLDGSINYDFKGRLSFSWPAQDSETPFNYSPLFQYGYGLTYK